MKQSDSNSVTSSSSASNKKEWLHKWIQKLSQTIQTDENKKMLQVFLIDPILNHILERLFPYIVIMCVLFVLLTIMITLTLLLVFTRLPAALGVKMIS
jgi:hypothetical protein